MIEYLIGVDGGGSGTRVCLARRDATVLAQGRAGPSGLAHGIDKAWRAIGSAIAQAFEAAGLKQPAPARIAIGLGLAGVLNKQWASAFTAAAPAYGALQLESDSFTTLVGAHRGGSGAIIALGTGSVGEALLPCGSRREVGGWGFPSGDEASGGWIGLRAINHVEQVLDGRRPSSAFAQAVIAQCGASHDGLFTWLAQASQTDYATLAPLVLAHAGSDSVARGIVASAGIEVASIAAALDPSGTLPIALCGGLAGPLRGYLPASLLARCVPAQGDSTSGALRMIELHLREGAHADPAQ